eukprot:GHVU01186426.1.p1 GENE.GHVU01186426.1~~GHVU01186426.1.p1  ORF type:complete len:121 (-),score=8.34 GHVU01186426.1:144-506(-)
MRVLSNMHTYTHIYRYTNGAASRRHRLATGGVAAAPIGYGTNAHTHTDTDTYTRTRVHVLLLSVPMAVGMEMNFGPTPPEYTIQRHIAGGTEEVEECQPLIKSVAWSSMQKTSICILEDK